MRDENGEVVKRYQTTVEKQRRDLDGEAPVTRKPRPPKTGGAGAAPARIPGSATQREKDKANPRAGYDRIRGKLPYLSKSDPVYLAEKAEAMARRKATGAQTLLPVPHDMDFKELKSWVDIVLGSELKGSKSSWPETAAREFALGIQESIEKTGIDPSRIKKLSTVRRGRGRGSFYRYSPWTDKGEISYGQIWYAAELEGGQYVRAWDYQADPSLRSKRRNPMNGYIDEDGNYNAAFHPSADPASVSMHEFAHYLSLIDKRVWGQADQHLSTGMATRDEVRALSRISTYGCKNRHELMAEGFVMGMRFGWDRVPESVRKAWGVIIEHYGGRLE